MFYIVVRLKMAEFVRDIEAVVDVREGFGLNIERFQNVRAREDPFQSYTDREFRNRYRLSKAAVHYVIDLVQADLQPLSLQALNISPFKCL